jgi:hypothetical protein
LEAIPSAIGIIVHNEPATFRLPAQHIGEARRSLEGAAIVAPAR